MPSDYEQTVEVEGGGELNYTLELLDGRTMLLHVRVLSRHSVKLGISASIATPQPAKVIQLVPESNPVEEAT